MLNLPGALSRTPFLKGWGVIYESICFATVALYWLILVKHLTCSYLVRNLSNKMVFKLDLNVTLVNCV